MCEGVLAAVRAEEVSSTNPSKPKRAKKVAAISPTSEGKGGWHQEGGG